MWVGGVAEVIFAMVAGVVLAAAILQYWRGGNLLLNAALPVLLLVAVLLVLPLFDKVASQAPLRVRLINVQAAASLALVPALLGAGLGWMVLKSYRKRNP